MMLLLLGCISQEINYKQYNFSIEVTNATPEASHHATLLFEWFGEGPLRYPMYPLEETSFPNEKINSWEVLVEQELGEGLAIYVWEDVDGDDVLCSLDNRTERSGLLIFDDSKLDNTLEVELTGECLGFERLFDLQE